MATLTIELPDKMYGQLIEYCDVQGYNLQDYAFDTLADKLFTDLHGDLNQSLEVPTDKVNKEEQQEIKAEEVSEVVESEPVENHPNISNQGYEKNIATDNPMKQSSIIVEPTQRKRTRTIKAK